MDLQPIIAELEEQATRYANAANTLRALLPLKEPAIPAVVRQAIAPNALTSAGNKSDGRKRKRSVSPETRAKLSAAIKAAHARRKAATGA